MSLRGSSCALPSLKDPLRLYFDQGQRRQRFTTVQCSASLCCIDESRLQPCCSSMHTMYTRDLICISAQRPHGPEIYFQFLEHLQYQADSQDNGEHPNGVLVRTLYSGLEVLTQIWSSDGHITLLSQLFNESTAFPQLTIPASERHRPMNEPLNARGGTDQAGETTIPDVAGQHSPTHFRRPSLFLSPL
ncbi:hypothetical protein BJX68DRAFT_52556 [Aspergillus pseudodeflectus]|uniref:Uncharacterized protein n=1 Tax=Aspergillus pseudodeflectus TaxID=176178 RepID=A0ABR4KLJ8_9EURO